MEAAEPRGEGGIETGPHFTDEAGADEAPAWEQIAAGRYMPRRIRGSYRGRALG
jgi:hypothetical protein